MGEPGSGLGDPKFTFLLAEYEHTVTQRGQMWSAYVGFLRMYFAILSVPFPAAAILLERSSVANMPTVVTLLAPAMLFVGVLGLLLLPVIIHMRLDVLVFSRSLNGIRGLMASLVHLRLTREITLLPAGSTEIPGFWEPFRQTGIIVAVGAFISSIYVILFCEANWQFRLIVTWQRWFVRCAIPILAIFVSHVIYYLMARFRRHVPGPMRGS